MHDATRLLRATLTPADAGTPLHSSPVFAAPYHAPGEPAGVSYSYGGAHNPTWTELERVLGVLEVSGGDEPAGVRVYGSGMAAVAAVFATVLRPGDTVLVPGNAYFGARQLLTEYFAPLGVTVRLVGIEQLYEPETLAGVRLLWLETPSNPTLEITDMHRVVEAAHAAGALVAFDNTIATPMGQRPLVFGADFSVCSGSKMIGGHSDLLLGHVATRSAELLGALDAYRNRTGGILGPMEAWLALRSLATLALRLEKGSSNALGLAEFLRSRGEVSDVLYPGLPGHPGHATAAAQMRFFGPVLGFTLPSQAAAEQFLERAQLITQATSFGGVTTTAERRARWGHDAVPPGFIRLSAGCEDLDDLREDMAHALKGLA